MESQLGLLQRSFDLRYSEWVSDALNELPDCFSITDPYVSTHPIVFASNGFLKMVGYSREEVIGRNGRMFQGPETERRSVMLIREAIREERGLQISLLNYRKDGTPFWILFQMCPLFSEEDGRLINFVAVQVPISRKPRLRNDTRLCKGGGGLGDSLFRSCRRELWSDSIREVGCASDAASASSHDDGEDGINLPCEANEQEKDQATAAMANILSVLTHYSEFTGRLVCRTRCCPAGNAQLHSSLTRIKESFVLADALSPDMPIVYASEGFHELTGYAEHEARGLNCRFLSGAGTDPDTKLQIRECIGKQQACTARILNYRKDKTPFWNDLHISPVRNASGKVAFFVGIQMDDDCKKQDANESSPEARQRRVVAAVKVAVRGWSMGGATS